MEKPFVACFTLFDCSLGENQFTAMNMPKMPNRVPGIFKIPKGLDTRYKMPSYLLNFLLPVVHLRV